MLDDLPDWLDANSLCRQSANAVVITAILGLVDPGQKTLAAAALFGLHSRAIRRRSPEFGKGRASQALRRMQEGL